MVWGLDCRCNYVNAAFERETGIPASEALGLEVNAGSREEERHRIARELHDELGQQLSTLRFGLNLLDFQLERSVLYGAQASLAYF